MVKVISVKFKNGGKPYYFAPNGNEVYEKGMGVVVETAKGLEYATVVQPETEVDESSIVSPLKPVVRIATKRDEEQVKRNIERRGEAIKTAQAKVAERGLEMKIVDCEFAFDGSKVVLFFTAESRVDFRELIKDLSSAFHMRIELRQINIRDEIKLTGGLAPCGRACCCIGSISEPKKVSVKMAKNQGLSLNPTKISGLCGRLMCCLAYENDYYAEACKKMPKIGSEADTPDGKGIVVNVNMLKMLIKVKIEQNDSVSYHDYPVDQLTYSNGGVVVNREEAEEQDEEEREDLPVQPEVKRTENVGEGERKQGGKHRNRNKGHKNGNQNPNQNQNNNNGQNNQNQPQKQGGEHRENRNKHGDRHNRQNENRPNQNNQQNQNNNQNNVQNRGDGRGQDGSHNNNPNQNRFKNRHRDRRRENGKAPVNTEN